MSAQLPQQQVVLPVTQVTDAERSAFITQLYKLLQQIVQVRFELLFD